jgi:transposase
MKQSTMSVITQIFERLRAGKSYDDIADEFRISKSTISKYVNRLLQSGQNLSSASEMTESELEVFVRIDRSAFYDAPDCADIYKKLEEVPGATRRILYDRYVEEHGSRVCSYPTFCRLLADYKRSLKPRVSVTNMERLPGEAMEIDFAGKRLLWIDDRGVQHKSKLFVSVLSYSQYMFVWACENEKQINWIQGVNKALEYFGGSPKTLVVDNAKALVISHQGVEVKYHPELKSLCEYYKMTPLACRPRGPKGKNRVENGVSHTYNFIIASLSLDGTPRFSNIDALNEQILVKLNEFNDRPFTKNKESSRRREFEEGEMKLLQSLPGSPFETGIWHQLKADKGHCITIHKDCGHRYSVPPAYAEATVLVLKTESTIAIYDRNTQEEIAVHKRHTEQTGEKTHILPEHYTKKELLMRKPLSGWVTELSAQGLDKDLVQRSLAEKWKLGNMVGQRFAVCLMKFLNRNPSQYVLAALQEAFDYHCLSSPFIRDHIEFNRKLDALKEQSLQAEETDPDYRTPEHENIRNNYH